jgi:hypothetical protein
MLKKLEVIRLQWFGYERAFDRMNILRFKIEGMRPMG